MTKSISVMFDDRDESDRDQSGYWISPNNGKKTGFPVFHVLADKHVPDERMIHVAGIAAQILDRDANFRPDGGSKNSGSGITLARKLRDNFAHITIHSAEMMTKSNKNDRRPMYDYFDTTNFKKKTGS